MVVLWVLLLLAVLPVCAVASLHVFVTTVGVLRRAAYLRHTRAREPLTPRALVHELGCMFRLTWWELRAVIPRRRSGNDGRTVLLIHGALGARPSHLLGVRRMVERHGRRARFVDVTGWLGGPRAKVPRLARALERAHAHSPDGLDVVTHSMGGVLLRAVLAERPDLAAHVRRVVCLGAPHRGTALARGLGWLPDARALHRRNRWLKELPPLSQLVPHARVTTVAGREDFIVYPPETTDDPGARRVVLDGLGHAGLLVSRRALRATLRGLHAA